MTTNMITSEKKYPLIHPGEILREELMTPHNLTAEKLAQELKVDQQIIQDLISEQSNITADLATRLALYFGISTDFWINCQHDYDAKLSEKLLTEKQIRSEVKSRSSV